MKRNITVMLAGMIVVFTASLQADRVAPDRASYPIGGAMSVRWDLDQRDREEVDELSVTITPEGQKSPWTTRQLDAEHGPPVQLTAPVIAGEYVLALLEGEETRATARFSTYVKQAKGALRLAARRAVIKSKLSLIVDIPEGQYRKYGAWVGLYRVRQKVKGNAVRRARKIREQRLSEKPLEWRVPTEPGTYEFRLYDRPDNFYVIDSIRFEAYVPPARSALSLERDRYVVGEKMQLRIELPEDREYSYPRVGMYRSGRRVEGGGVVEAGRLKWEAASTGPLTWTAPAKPGEYEIRLFDRNDYHRYGLARVQFTTYVPPAPDVLSMAKNEYISGEKITLKVNLPGGRHYKYPWVGIYRIGEDLEGGAKAETYRITDKRVKEKMGWTAPSAPGEYEFRVFDRDDDGRYGLDRIRFTVVVTPTPGALALDKETYVVGEPMDLTVNLQEGRHYKYPWIGLYSIGGPLEGGAEDETYRKTDKRVKEKMTWNAPSSPGQYEFRLFDRDNDGRYRLDSIRFTVVITPPPGALSLEKKKFVVGAAFDLTVNLPEGRYYHYPRVKLYRLGEQVAGGAVDEAWWLDTEHVEETLSFKAPKSPGRFEFRLYDSDRHYVLDRIGFSTYVSPALGAMSLEKRDYVVGEKFELRVNLPEGRYYNYPRVKLYRTGGRVEGGAVDETWWLDTETVKERISFTAPKSPGRYEFRLYDRNRRYVLDRIAFATHVPPAPDALSLDKKEYTVAEWIKLTVQMPEGRYYNYPRVGLYRRGGRKEGQATVTTSREESEYARNGVMMWRAPEDPGRYEFRLFDRHPRYYGLDRVRFETVVPASDDYLNLTKKVLSPSEPLALRLNVPEALQRRLTLEVWTARLEVTGGAVMGENRESRTSIEKGQTPQIKAPRSPGRYEARLFYRSYRIARVEFTVEGRDPFEGSATPSPGEALADTPEYHFAEWDELTVSEREHWRRLGWGGDNWVAGIPLELARTRWEDLTQVQREAAQAVGLDRRSWNEQIYNPPTGATDRPSTPEWEEEARKTWDSVEKWGKRAEWGHKLLTTFIEKLPKAEYDRMFQDLERIMDQNPAVARRWFGDHVPDFTDVLKDEPAKWKRMTRELLNERPGIVARFLRDRPEMLQRIETAGRGLSALGALVSLQKAAVNLEKGEYGNAAMDFIDVGFSGLKTLPSSYYDRLKKNLGKDPEASAKFLKNLCGFMHELTRVKTPDKPLSEGVLIKESAQMLANAFVSLPEDQQRRLITKMGRFGKGLNRFVGERGGQALGTVVGLLDALPEVDKLLREWDTGKRWVNISNVAQKLGPKVIRALVYAHTRSANAADVAEFLAQQGTDYLAGLGKEAREARMKELEAAMSASLSDSERIAMMRRLAAEVGLNRREKQGFEALVSTIGGHRTNDWLQVKRRSGDVAALRAAIAAYRRANHMANGRVPGVRHFYETVRDASPTRQWKEERLERAREAITVVRRLRAQYGRGTAPHEFLTVFEQDLRDMVRTYGR